MTRFHVLALRSVDLGTPDLERSTEFYVNVWGLELVERIDDSVYLRASGDDHHVLALHSSARAELKSVTFRCKDVADLDRISTAAAAHGCAIEFGPAASGGPGGGTMLAIREPQG